ncbi:MAG: hypothetical protein ACRDD8_14815 [Bacteroidales bacterium]
MGNEKETLTPETQKRIENIAILLATVITTFIYALLIKIYWVDIFSNLTPKLYEDGYIAANPDYRYILIIVFIFRAIRTTNK